MAQINFHSKLKKNQSVGMERIQSKTNNDKVDNICSISKFTDKKFALLWH
jgi:hypothetical protein